MFTCNLAIAYPHGMCPIPTRNILNTLYPLQKAAIPPRPLNTYVLLAT